MDRREELKAVIGDEPVLEELLDEVVYLEAELDRLRELPKLRVHPKDPTMQKVTPAARMYREYMGQYLNILRLIVRAKGIDETEEETPLRKWVNERMDSG